MSEIRRRRTQVPELMVPQREDAALDAEAARLQQMATAASQPQIPAESPVRTESEEAAYNLGQKMGAESIAAMVREPAATTQPMRGITEERLIEAEHLLMRYKAGKSSVDRRIINAQQWWKMRNWEQIENDRGTRLDRKSTRLNSSHYQPSRMPSSA